LDRQLIYDVGAHCGNDTGRYLELGYRVVAIEADPGLCSHLHRRFSREIAAGDLTVLNFGIAECDGELPFYLCSANSEWNSFDPNWACKHGTTSVEARIACRRFDSILTQYGVPRFLKVDIEGYDHLCLEALSADNAPEYVSFECDRDSLAMVARLFDIGYRRFNLVNQFNFTTVSVPYPGDGAHLKWSLVQLARRFVRAHPRVKTLVSSIRPKPRREPGHIASSSGPVPMSRDQGWQDLNSFVYAWTNIVESGQLLTSWYDIHVGR
jgi:FkbM family methyltransferase